MKCLSCEVEIDPKWKFAIEQNVCPFCGESILPAELKELLSTLRNTMDALQNYPEQLEDWLFSNFSFLKTSSPKLIEFVDPELLRKGTKKRDDIPAGEVIKIAGKDVPTQKQMSDSEASEFMKRAQVVKKNDATPVAEKDQRLRSMINQIKDGGMITEIDPDAEGVDPEAAEEYRAAMSVSDDFIPSGSGNSLSTGIDFGGGQLPYEVEMMASQGGPNQKDMWRLRQMMEKKNSARDNFESGTNRGGKSGGFSRSG